MSSRLATILPVLALLALASTGSALPTQRLRGFRDYIRSGESIDMGLTAAKKFACTVCASVPTPGSVKQLSPKLMALTGARVEEKEALEYAAMHIAKDKTICNQICPANTRKASGPTQFSAGDDSVKVKVHANKAGKSKVEPQYTGTPEPFILFPGLDAQELIAKLDNAKPPHFFCDRTTDKYFTIWLELSLLLPGFDDCFYSDMALIYDIESNTFANNTGVSLKAKTGAQFGDVDGVLGFHLLGKTYPMYSTIFGNLTKYGWQVGKTIFAAPYDFRLDPGHMDYWRANVTALVERIYTMNNNTKVHLVGHSYGCSVGIYFLRHAPQAWKDKYIASWFSFSGPYFGSTITPGVTLAGAFPGTLHGGINFKPSSFSNMLQNWGVAIYLFPAASAFGNDTIVSIGDKDYASQDLGQLFTDLNLTTSAAIWKSFQADMNDASPPNVTTYCVHGIGLNTTYNVHFNDSDVLKPGNSQVVANISGDGVVPLPSLMVCPGWKGQQAYNVTEISVPGMQHGLGPWLPNLFAYWMGTMGVTEVKK